MGETVLEKYRWEALAEGLPDEAVAIVRKAEEVIDRLNFIIGLISGESELTTIEQNLEVMRLGVSIETLVNMVISQVKLHGGSGKEIDQLIAEFRNLVKEVQESQASGSFASTPKGTAEYIVKILNILERVYMILATSKYLWMFKLGAEHLPRRAIQEAVNQSVKKYLDAILPAAQDTITIMTSSIPKTNPDEFLEKVAFYILLAPQKYIPKRTYLQVLSDYLEHKKYQPIKKVIELYTNKSYEKYTYEATKLSRQSYVLSQLIETDRVSALLYYQSTIEAYLDAIDIDSIFKSLEDYTKDEIEITMTATRETKNIELFWDIFVKVALKSVGVHVEWEFEEEGTTKKKKKKKEKEVIEVELPPEVESEIGEMMMEGLL